MKNIHQFNRFSAGESMQKRMVFVAGGPEKQETVPMPKKPGEEQDTMKMVDNAKKVGATAIEGAGKSFNQLKQGKDGQETVEDPNKSALKEIGNSFNKRFDLTPDKIVSELKAVIDAKISGDPVFAGWLKGLRQEPPKVTIHQKDYIIRWDPSANKSKGGVTISS